MHDSRHVVCPAAARYPTRRFVLRCFSLTVAALAALVFAAPSSARGYPPSVPKNWHAPQPFYGQAMCVHSYEGALNAATGNGYEGGWQFLRSTWQSVGGPVDSRGHWASTASPREQLYRVWLLWTRDGQSWREWGTAGRCGLR